MAIEPAEPESSSSPDSSFDEKVSLSLEANLANLNIKNPDEQSKADSSPINVALITMQRKSVGTFPITSEDSGTDAEIPSYANSTKEERVKMLQDLLEIYFSDNYLSRDIFLLKHFRKSKGGWISFKFMASYKRIKRRARDISEVIEAVENSTLLEFNEEKTKVRRTAPLPSCIDEYIPTRMALVGGLPDTLRSLTAASKYLSPYGNVESLQLLRPGGVLPELLWETAETHPELREQWCLVVEYEDMHAAGKLVEAVNENKTEPGQPTWVLELVMHWRRRRQECLRVSDLSSCTPCNSSGQNSNVSSPQPTPDSSPCVRTQRQKGLTKRERIAARSKSPLPPTTSSSKYQMKYQNQLSTHTQLLNTSNNNFCRRAPSSDCDNWRTASAF
ncbi:unnamed protein product [Meganyctiphanes norvegica]|uniref:HTH La-type RNA-binding domain-containing protein n=1 Tax=Meganyctiphanes norvegica TaxID=48144 RepID=A0AAV2Q775_MEGNR